MFLTQVIGIPVIDRAGNEVGILSDLVVAAGEVFPRVIGLEIKSETQTKIVSSHQVDLLSHWVVTLKEIQARLPLRSAMPTDLFLAKDFLDKQILDIDGAKVVRVNDLKIARFNGDFHLIAADVGLSGLLRRLKVESLLKKATHMLGKPLHDHLVAWNLVEPISGHNPKVKLMIPQSKMSQLHPADIAQILKELSPPERAAVLESLDEEKAAEALHDVEPALTLDILDDLSPEKATSILEEMNPDDAADILSELPQEKVEEILSDISAEDAADLKQLLSHREDTAGGLMTTEFVSLPEELSAAEAIARLRKLSDDTETVYYLYITDHEEHLKGVVSLRNLIVAESHAKLKDIMAAKPVKVTSSAHKEEVVELIAKYDLLALPVVDGSEKLVGIVTVDDIVDVLLPARWKRKVR